jgi:hypothetical protein
MAAGRALCHTAKKLETFPLHKITGCEVLRQQCVNFLIGQFTGMKREPGTLHLYLSHLIHQ